MASLSDGFNKLAHWTALQAGRQLTVDDSGIAVRSHGDRRDDGPTIARQLVLRLG